MIIPISNDGILSPCKAAQGPEGSFGYFKILNHNSQYSDDFLDEIKCNLLFIL